MSNVGKILIKSGYYVLILGVASIGLLLLATMIPIPGNFKAKIVKSGSMEPAIKTGGIVLIKHSTSYVVGDVITFGPDTKTQIPTTHRILKIEGEGVTRLFTTKGDANDAADPVPVRPNDIDGKVFFSAPYVGYVLDFARKPIGFILLVGIPATLIIFDEILKIWRELRRIRRDKNRGGGGDGGSNERQVNSRSRIVDLRVRPVLQPVMLVRKKTGSHFPLRALSLFLVIFGPIIGISSFGGTIAYYNENEYSLGNVLRASTEYDLVVVPTPAPAAALLVEVQVGEESEATTSPEISEVASSTEPAIVLDVSDPEVSEELTEEIVNQNMDETTNNGDVKKPVEGEEGTEETTEESAPATE